MSLLRIKELESQLARQDERIAELERALQRRGEPVAWYRWSELYRKRLFTDVMPTEELAWIPLYSDEAIAP